jgi:hypothetical protein
MSFVYFWRKKIFCKKSWWYPGGTPDKNFHSNFWTEISRFIYQSTQSFTEIKNLILFLLKNVIIKARIRRLCPNGLVSCNFAFIITFFNKNNIKFLISMKDCVDWYINWDISVQKLLWKFLSGVPPGYHQDFCEKVFFVKNIQMTCLSMQFFTSFNLV